MAFQAFDREFAPVDTSQASPMADPDIRPAQDNLARAESNASRPNTKTASMAKDLDRFKEQFYQCYFLDKYELRVVKQKFDRLFEIIFAIEGQSYQANDTDWRNRLRTWNKHWKLRKNGADRQPYPADLDRNRVYYEGHQPLFEHLPSGWKMDEWPNVATGLPTCQSSQPSIQSYAYSSIHAPTRNEISEHDLAGEVRPEYSHPGTDYAPEFDQLLCTYSHPPEMPFPVADPIANSANLSVCATEAEHYPGEHLGATQAQSDQDILRRDSAPDTLTANKQYAIIGVPDGPQTRSLSLPETLQSPERFLPSSYVPSWPDSNINEGADGQGLPSRKRPSRSSFIESPSIRLKSPHPNTPLSASRPRRCMVTLQSTLSDGIDDEIKEFDHMPMPNQGWGSSSLEGLARASTYTDQLLISSSTSPSTPNPGGFPQAASQEAYVTNQDWIDFNGTVSEKTGP